jgi:pilus assembly protein CpaE
VSRLGLIILAADEQQRIMLQMLVDATNVAETVGKIGTFPSPACDNVLRQIADSKADGVLFDLPAGNPDACLQSIEYLHSELPSVAIFVVGDISQPQNIVRAMRAGACEFLERPLKPASLLEALARMSTKERRAVTRGRLVTFVNAKGGSGGTTLAVNTALTLQAKHGGVVLVDVAPLGHAALHLNVQPGFGIMDAVQNLHRLDISLLNGFMTPCKGGLNLLAGTETPVDLNDSAAGMGRLFDLLLTNYQYVIVDASSRLDDATRFVCSISDRVLLVSQCDGVSLLYGGGRVRNRLGELDGNRIRLVLNRYHKLNGFTESDAEAACDAEILCRVPNHYRAMSNAIDRGTPLAQQNSGCLAGAFVDLAESIARDGRTPADLSPAPLEGYAAKRPLRHVLRPA